MTAEEIIHKVSATLLDEGMTSWTIEELFDSLNTAVREVARRDPSAYMVTETITLSSGTKQQFPAAATGPVTVSRNMGIGGIAPGKAPFITLLDVLDKTFPQWGNVPAAAEVQLYAYSRSDKNTFYVYPPQPSTGRGTLEVAYPSEPPVAKNLNEKLVINSSYEGALVDYILYRSFMKESENQASIAKASGFFNAFLSRFQTKAAE